jgi:hypothetical protein
VGSTPTGVLIVQLPVQTTSRNDETVRIKTSLNGPLSQPNCQPGIHDGPNVATPGDRFVSEATLFDLDEHGANVAERSILFPRPSRFRHWVIRRRVLRRRRP